MEAQATGAGNSWQGYHFSHTTYWLNLQRSLPLYTMSSLSNHPKQIPGVTPPLAYLTRYVDQDAGHWFWRESRPGHRHLRSGHAVLRWKVRPTVRTQFVAQGSYSVARLLLEHVRGALPPDCVIKNLCRLPQCVNPAHWAVTGQGAPAYVLAPWGDGAEWQIVEGVTRQPPPRAAAVRMLLPDRTVHVVHAIPPVSRAPDAPLLTMCGKPVRGPGLLLVESQVTCTEGC